jgi:hypothetical protein
MSLSVMLFAKCMTHRTQIYFFLLDLWYRIQRSEITARVAEFFARVVEGIKSLVERIRARFSGRRDGLSLNDALNLDAGDMSEGLLLRETS